MRRLASRVGVLGSAVCGVVAAHAAAYALVFPDRHLRHATLGETGHAYWPSAVLVAAALGIAIAGARVVRALRDDAPTGGLLREVVRLWSAQTALFLVLETVERAAVGAPVGGLLGTALLPAAIAMQLLAAAAITLAVRLLARGAAALVRSLRRARPGRARIPAARRRPGATLRPPLVLAGAQGSRGPPRT